MAWWALLGWLGCSLQVGGGDEATKEAASEAAEPVIVVETATIGRGSVKEQLVVSAVVESERVADLLPATTGVAREVRAEVGDAVSAGQVLAVLENVSLDAGAARAGSELTRLEEQVAESRRLREQGAISDRELADLEHQLRTAKVNAREARASFGQTRLTAPFDGVVASRGVRVGELVSAATPAFQVVDLNLLRVVARFPERDLRRIKVGQAAELVASYDDALRAEGRVERVAPVIDASSGTFQVIVGVLPGQDHLRPGQFVSAGIEVDRRDQVLVVPRVALVYEDGLPLVFVVEPGKPDESEGEDQPVAAATPSWWPFGRGGADEDEEAEEEQDAAGPFLVAQRRPVELGLGDRQQVEVRSGLAEGESVVVLGQSHLRDGARVRLPEAKVDPSAPRAAAPAAENDG